MNLSYRYRLFTNANQERELARAVETHRRMFNAFLDGKQLCWETEGVDWSRREQSKWLTIQRRLNPHWSAVNRAAAEQTLRRLDRGYRAFYARRKKGLPGRPPRFKGRDQFHSFTLVAEKMSDGWKRVGDKLRLQGIGTIRVKWHRPLPADGEVKLLRIMRENGKWFAVFVVDVPEPALTGNSKHVGIDVGLKSFVTTSDGESLGDSRSLERVLPELRRRQRTLSRCKNGSSRRKQVKSRVTALHAKVRNTRKDLHRKVAKSLVDRYGVIAAESLNIQGMLKNRRLARRISDAGWYSFTQILIGKAAIAGCKIVLVDPRNTSQECSSCGQIVRKSLAVRVHRCECGCVLDRDVNAAKNVAGRAARQGAKTDTLVLS